MASLSSAANGAAEGAAVGSIIPGIGTAIGGLVGGIAGLFGGGSDPTPQMPNLTPTVTSGQISLADTSTADALKKQNDFVNAVNAANGIGNQSQVFNQLQGVAAGTGPNPALAALNNATGTNVANEAALIGSARGASANPGLVARNAAIAGAGIQQNAVGQAAALQSQQQLNAINAAGGIASNQAAQQAQGVQALNAAAQGQQSNILNAAAQYNNALVSGTGNVNTNQTSLTEASNKLNAQAAGGALNAAGVAAGLNKSGGSGSGTPAPSTGAPNYSLGANTQFSAPPEFKYAGGTVGTQLKAGGKVPGKAKVAGDSQKNDNVHALLSPDEIVLPRSVTMSKNAPDQAAKFVAAVLKEKSLKRK